MGCNCNRNSHGKCRSYGKPGCLCALSEKLATIEPAEEHKVEEAD